MPHLDWPTKSKVKTGTQAQNSQQIPSKKRSRNHSPLRCCHAATCKKPRMCCRHIEPPLTWIRMGAIFLMNAIIAIPDTTFGLLYDSLIELYGATRAEVGWTFSILITTGMLTGMFASPFMDLYGCRPVSMFGAILYTTGMVLAPFAPNLICLYLSYGLIAGVGWGIALVSGMTVIQNIFTYNRGLATGLVAFGFTLGTVVSPLLMEGLLETYGIRGALLMHGGIVAQTLVLSTAFQTKRKPLDDSAMSRSSLSVHEEVEFEQVPCAPPWEYVEYHNGVSPSIEPWSYEAWPITTCIEEAEGVLRPVTGGEGLAVAQDPQIAEPEQTMDGDDKKRQPDEKSSTEDLKDMNTDQEDFVDSPHENKSDNSDDLSREEASTSSHPRNVRDAGESTLSKTDHSARSEGALSSTTDQPDPGVHGSDGSGAAPDEVDDDPNQSMQVIQNTENNQEVHEESITEKDASISHSIGGSECSVDCHEAEESKCETLGRKDDAHDLAQSANNISDTTDVRGKEELSPEEPSRDLDSAPEGNQENTDNMVEEIIEPIEDKHKKRIVEDQESENDTKEGSDSQADNDEDNASDIEPVEVSEEKQVLLNSENPFSDTSDTENITENISATGAHSVITQLDNRSEISLQACDSDVSSGLVGERDHAHCSKSNKRKLVSELFKNFKDFSLFKDPVFVLYIVCNFMTLIGRMCLVTHFPSAAYHRGASSWEVATFMTVVGVSNFISRAASTLLLNIRKMNYIAYYTVGLLFLTTSGVLAIWAKNYNTMVICMTLLGTCEGISNTVFPLVITSIAGVDRFAKALGLLNAAVLWTPFVAAPLSGWLVDITEDYIMTFVLGSTCSVLSTMFGVIAVIVQEVRRRKKKQPKVEDTVDSHISQPEVYHDAQI